MFAALHPSAACRGRSHEVAQVIRTPVRAIARYEGEHFDAPDDYQTGEIALGEARAAGDAIRVVAGILKGALAGRVLTAEGGRQRQFVES